MLGGCLSEGAVAGGCESQAECGQHRHPNAAKQYTEHKQKK